MDQLPGTLTCGYHGTSDVHAAAIMRDGFRPSVFEGDWLGSVAYFFNDQDRAEQWALRTVHRDGGKPIVIKAIIDLSDCLDLTLRRFRHQLATIAETVVAEMPTAKRTQLRQTDKRRELDCLVVNALLRASRRPDGRPVFITVRAVFAEGEPLFSSGALRSGIHADDHIQIGVVDSSAILDLELISARVA